MTTEELKIKVRFDFNTAELKNGIKQVEDMMSNTSKQMGGVDKATKDATNNTTKLSSTLKAMGTVSMAQTGYMMLGFQKMSKEIKRTVSHVSLAGTEIADAFNFKNFDVGNDGLKGYLQSMRIQAQEAAKSLKPVLTNALKAVATGAAAVVGAITGTVVAFSHLSESTREFRQAINQVSTSFIALGSDAETAKEAYQGFYRVLGDVQRSTEAANLLAQITTEEKELATWTKIATGALAMFPDSLPTESLIEASNETIKTAKVTGTLADALNWPAAAASKISKALEGSVEAQRIFNQNIAKGLTVEEAFNQVLAATNSETQREILLRAALNGIYAESAGLYEEINKELIAQNEAQNKLNQAMATLGKITQPLQTAFTNLKATLATALAPAIKVVCDWLVVLVNWLSTAMAWVGAFLSVIFPNAAEKIESAFNGASSAIGGVTSGTDSLGTSLKEAEGTAQKLRRTLMGFDELNVVGNMSSSGSGSGAGTGSGTGAGGGLDVSGIDVGDSVFKKAQEQMDEMKKKAKEIWDEWKTEIAIIAAALATLGVAGLLEGLGKAIGLGDKFLGIMSTIKKIAATAITIVLQYSLVNEFMDNYIDGEGFKEYLKGLIVAAIGTGVLYSMWGPTGLVIGLAVTAAASIKAVIDNGGITNIESGIVAFTGLAAAIGAVSAAIKAFKLGDLVKNLGAFFALVKEGNGFVATLAAAFPKLAGVIGTITGALSGFLGSIGAVFGATGTAAVVAGAAVIVAAIVGIISVIKFLKENWDAVGQAARDFFDNNIAPKLDNIRESFRKVGEALGPVGEAIGNIVKKVVEWVKSIDWLDGIGKAFEVLGGILFAAVTGPIAGAINAFVSIWEGAAQAISGVVQILSGAVKAIIKLFSGDLQAAKDACEDILDGIVDLFEGLYKAIVGPVKEFVEGVIKWFVELWDELVGHSVVPDMMDDIVGCFKELPERVFKWVKNLADGVVKRTTDMWNNVVSGTRTKLGEARTTIMSGWNNIKSYFNANIAPKLTKQYWLNKIDTVRAGLQQKLGEARTQIMNSWNAIRGYFTENIAPKLTKDYWMKKIDTIKQAASSKLGEVRTTIMNAWNSIKSWFNTNVKSKLTVSYWSAKWGTIKDGAKSAFNGVISIVEKAVNRIINKINTLSWTIPDWVPGVGGDKFGFNFKTISIPRLATGGIALRSTLANIGENGREAILPLDNNTSWMDALANKLATRMNTPTKIVLKVGEKELGWATIHGINQITRQTGELQLQL